MADYSNELVAKLKKAQSLEEVTELLNADGQDPADAGKIWNELVTLHEGEDKELSLDELESVAGGVKHRNWLEKGCAATVESGSNCWGTDGGCSVCNIKYNHGPTTKDRCPTCGRYVYYVGLFEHKGNNLWSTTYKKKFICRTCGEYEVDW